MFGCIWSLIHTNSIELLYTTLVAERENQQDLPAKYFFSVGVLQGKSIFSGIKKFWIIHLKNLKEFCKFLIQDDSICLGWSETGSDAYVLRNPKLLIRLWTICNSLKSSLNLYFSMAFLEFCWIDYALSECLWDFSSFCLFIRFCLWTPLTL